MRSGVLSSSRRATHLRTEPRSALRRWRRRSPSHRARLQRLRHTRKRTGVAPRNSGLVGRARDLPGVRLYDECMKVDGVQFSLGFMKPSTVWPFGNATSYGSPRSGGSLGLADPTAGVGYAYVTSQMCTRLTGDPRDVALREALYSSILGSPGAVGKTSCIATECEDPMKHLGKDAVFSWAQRQDPSRQPRGNRLSPSRRARSVGDDPE